MNLDIVNSSAPFKQKRGNSYVDQTRLCRYASWLWSDNVFCQPL